MSPGADGLIASFGQLLVGWGGPGLLIAFLGYENWRLKKNNEKLQDKLDASHQRVADIAAASERSQERVLGALQTLTGIVGVREARRPMHSQEEE